MFSAGMFTAFDSAMRVRSRGLVSGSPPPARAATVNSLITRVKTRPRLASAAPFLCLIVAHFEWPDMLELQKNQRKIEAGLYHRSLARNKLRRAPPRILRFPSAAVSLPFVPRDLERPPYLASNRVVGPAEVGSRDVALDASPVVSPGNIEELEAETGGKPERQRQRLLHGEVERHEQREARTVAGADGIPLLVDGGERKAGSHLDLSLIHISE